MKYRLLVIANIEFIIGIIIGLYFKNSIILFLSIFVVGIAILKLLKLPKGSSFFCDTSLKLKKWTKTSVPIVLGFFIITLNECKFEEFIKDMNYFKDASTHVYATVVSDKEEKEYSDSYKIKILNVNGKKYFDTYCLIKLKKQSGKELNYGDLIYFDGEFQEPQDRTNYKGYSYKEYLKTINTYGIFQTTYNKVKFLKEKNLGTLYLLANKVRNSFERTNR